MPIRVVTFSTYLTSIVGGWRSQDYDAHDFIRAIKDRNINKYGNARVRGQWRRFDNANRADVVSWFGEMVAEYIEENPVTTPIALVSVPGSKVDVAYTDVPRTTVLARAVSDRLGNGYFVRDVLRWREPMPSANQQGGSRDAATLYANLRRIGRINEPRAMLIDDVLTSGGHLRACAAKIRRAGVEVVFAVCAGRADQRQVPDAFSAREEELEDFDPTGT